MVVAELGRLAAGLNAGLRYFLPYRSGLFGFKPWCLVWRRVCKLKVNIELDESMIAQSR